MAKLRFSWAGPKDLEACFDILVLDGVFLVFAYVPLIAVKTELRGGGIGSTLLEEAERLIRNEKDYPFIKKSFHLVGKSNRRAKIRAGS